MTYVIGGMDANQCVLDGKVFMIGEMVKKDGFIFYCVEGGNWRIEAEPDKPTSDKLCTIQTNCDQATCKPTICHVCI